MYLVPLSALPSIQPLETVNQEPGAALKQQEGDAHHGGCGQCG